MGGVMSSNHERDLPIWAKQTHKNIIASRTSSEAFTNVYSACIWGKQENGSPSSGEGSSPNHAKPYMNFLQGYLLRHHIKSVLDVGCGTWEFSHQIDWNGIQYLGIDVVTSIIEQNQSTFGSETITFKTLDFLEEELPKADLLICKDVLQHLPLQDIQKFLTQAKRFRHCILTNDILTHLTEEESHHQNNFDIHRGEYRPLDLELPPFSVHGSCFLYKATGNNCMKKVVFLENSENI